MPQATLTNKDGIQMRTALASAVLMILLATSAPGQSGIEPQAAKQDRHLRLHLARLQAKVTLTVDRPVYFPGEEIEVIVTVQNQSTTMMEVEDPERLPRAHSPLFDMARINRDVSGHEHLQSLAPASEQPRGSYEVPLIQVDPGQERVYKSAWLAPYEEGTYQLGAGFWGRALARFDVRNPEVVEIAEIQRSEAKNGRSAVHLDGKATERIAPATARSLLVRDSSDQLSILVSVLPGDIHDQHGMKPGKPMIGGAQGYGRMRRIVAGRKAISNLRLSEDPANRAHLLVQFDEGGKPAKAIRLTVKYELLEAQ